MKHLHVACAIIQREGKVLATQRGANGNLPLKWEFPGGKIDPGETPEDCLHRELAEEMGVSVDIVRALSPGTHSYPSFTVTLYPFVCSVRSGQIVLREHAAAVWLSPEDLPALDWAEADVPVIRAYINSAEHTETIS